MISKVSNKVRSFFFGVRTSGEKLNVPTHRTVVPKGYVPYTGKNTKEYIEAYNNWCVSKNMSGMYCKH